MVAGDINEDVKAQDIIRYFQHLKERLSEVIANHFETYMRNNNRKRIDGIWTTPGIKLIRCRYISYINQWDHRALWIDFDKDSSFLNI